MTQEEDGPSWLNKGPIGPPIAHQVAWMGALSCGVLAYLLYSLGYLSRNLILVVVAAGYCIPFAVARELVAKRKRNFLDRLSDEEKNAPTP